MSPLGAYQAVANARPAAADDLVARHAGLVKRIAYHLAGRLPASVDADDLIQAGMIGLLEAAANYSSDRGASFETYAGIRIRGAMIDALRQLDWAPRSVHRKARKAADTMRELENTNGRAASDTEVASAMGIAIGEYHGIVEDAASCHMSSLDEVVGISDIPGAELDPLLDTENGALRTAVAEAIAALPERERLVMSMYYDEELNLKEIGAVLGVSESRVCQLHGQALVRLRGKLSHLAPRAMKKQPLDLLSILGIVLAFVALLVGAELKGAGLRALLSTAALMIVVVGTFAAILVQTPGRVMKHAFGILPWVFRSPVPDSQAIIKRMVEWSQIARRQGLLGLEPLLDDERDEFIRKGLQLVVDGSEPDSIRDTLEVDLEGREAADLRAAKVFEGMGIYAPTLGIIGAVLGLMAVMQNLTDPARLGTGIAAAFTATVYGIGLANLFLLPIAAKLRAAALAQSRVREMVVEGMIAIAQGENPRSIDTRLQSYLH